MKLSLLSILLGLGVGLPQVYGLAKPAQLGVLARKFPRNLPPASVLMLLGTAWFVWIVNNEPIADFSSFKPYMMAAFVAVGVLSCIFVQDFLAVRGLAVVLAAAGKIDGGHRASAPRRIAVRAGHPGLGLCFVIAGIWFTITPWKLRDLIELCHGHAESRHARQRCGWRSPLFIVALGLTVFRAM
jgi:hypothetical protein